MVALNPPQQLLPGGPYVLAPTVKHRGQRLGGGGVWTSRAPRATEHLDCGLKLGSRSFMFPKGGNSAGSLEVAVYIVGSILCV